MKKNTLIILSPGFAANEADTTCIPALQQFVIQLKIIRPELCIKVFALHYPFNEGKYFWHNLECFSFGGKNRRGLNALLLRRKAYKYISNYCQIGEVQGILSFWLSDCAYISQRLKIKYNISHFCWMFGQDARQGNKYVNKVNLAANQIIAFSDNLKLELKKNYGIVAGNVIENGVTESLFPDLIISNRSYDVLGVGSLIPLKDYSRFIKIIGLLKKEFPLINAAIIGEGNELENLQKQINDLGLAENVKLMGSIPHVEVLEYMNNSKVFLHTSTYEGSCGVIMEALYSGCQTVTTVSVSIDPVKNLYLSNDTLQLKEFIATLLKQNDLKAERVLYNSMANSAEQVISLFNL